MATKKRDVTIISTLILLILLVIFYLRFPITGFLINPQLQTTTIMDIATTTELPATTTELPATTTELPATTTELPATTSVLPEETEKKVIRGGSVYY